jgi:hypothetical protein
MEGSLVAYKVFTNGSTLQASELNENLMQQAVSTFSNAAARTAAITSPVEGQLTYLLDVDRYESWSGSAWIQVITPGAWVSFTPTFTGITLGNGTVSAKYSKVGRTVHLSLFLTLGSTSSITGWMGFSLPLSPDSNTVPSGSVTFGDAGTLQYPGFLQRGGSTIYANAIGTTGTYAAQAFTGSSVPFTWGTNDVFQVAFTYETTV